MKLLWHIVRKDGARLRLPLGLWGLLLLAKLALGAMLRAGGGADYVWFARLELYINLCTGLGALMVYVLVALLIHEDALGEASAAWRTRPISRARLLGAKLLGALLMFGVLPVLLSLPWWWVCGFGLRELGVAVLETLAWQALVVLPSLALAVLSHNFGRYFTLTLAVIFFVALAGMLQLAYLPDPAQAPLPVRDSRFWVVLALLLAGIVGVVLHQFLTLRTWRSCALGLGALALALASVSLWPWDVVTPARLANPAAARGVTLASPWATLDRNSEHQPNNVRVQFAVRNVPDGWVALGYTAQLSWRGPEGTRLGAHGWVSGGTPQEKFARSVHQVLQLPPERPDEETVRWQAQRLAELRARTGTSWVQGPPPARRPGEQAFTAYVNVKGYRGDQLPAQLAEGELTTDHELARPVPLLDLPLKPGARRSQGARSVRVTRIEPNPTKGHEADLIVRAVETQPSDLLRWLVPMFRYGWGFKLDGTAGYWVVDRAQGQARWQTSMGMGPTVWVNAVQLTWARWDVRAPRVVRGGQWVTWPANWADVVSLALVGYDQATPFQRTLPIERLEDPKAPAPETP